jgi:hypothetical protein
MKSAIFQKTCRSRLPVFVLLSTTRARAATSSAAIVHHPGKPGDRNNTSTLSACKAINLKKESRQPAPVQPCVPASCPLLLRGSRRGGACHDLFYN